LVLCVLIWFGDGVTLFSIVEANNVGDCVEADLLVFGGGSVSIGWSLLSV
jgi:hypothetical protein